MRIVDASILPLPTNANLNAAVILLAEKAASDILSEYGVDDVSKSNIQIGWGMLIWLSFVVVMLISRCKL